MHFHFTQKCACVGVKYIYQSLHIYHTIHMCIYRMYTLQGEKEISFHLYYYGAFHTNKTKTKTSHVVREKADV